MAFGWLVYKKMNRVHPLQLAYSGSKCHCNILRRTAKGFPLKQISTHPLPKTSNDAEQQIKAIYNPQKPVST